MRRLTRIPGLRIVVSALLTLPLMLSPLGATAPTRADELSDARARQAQLQHAIEQQRETLRSLRADESVLKDTLSTTADKLEAINADQVDLRARIATATGQLDVVQARYDGLVAKIGQLDWTLSLLQDELDQGEQDLAARRRLLADRLAEAYRTQQTSLLEQVLSADSFSDVFSEVDAYLRFGDQDRQLADQIERDQAALEALRRVTGSTRYRTDQLRLDAQAQAREIAGQRRELQAANRRLGTLQAQTQRLQGEQITHYQSTVASRQEAAAQLAADERSDAQLHGLVAKLVEQERKRQAAERARIAAEKARVAAEKARKAEEAQAAEEARARRAAQAEAAAAARANRTPRPQPKPRAEPKPQPGPASGSRPASRPQPPPRPSGTGELAWPVAGIVTQEYGCTGFPWEPARGSCAHFHEGIDISGAAGTAIRAAAPGVVVFSGFNPYDPPDDPAWIVTIAHDNGMISWYAHLQPKTTRKAHVGAHVAAGTIIGFMGNTGHSTGVHLHWQVELDGSPVNPRRFT